MPISGGTIYGRTEHEWGQLKEAGWDFLKDSAAERWEDAGRAAMGYLPGRVSRNRSRPAAGLLISALAPCQGEADAGPGFFNPAREVGQQRFLDDYRDALKFPLALYLAELACKYALPYPGEAAHAAQRHQA